MANSYSFLADLFSAVIGEKVHIVSAEDESSITGAAITID